MTVVDASVVAHVLAVETPGGPVHARLVGDEDLCAPHLLDLEVTSVLRALWAAGRLSQPDAAVCVGELQDMAILRYAHGALLDRVWELRHNLTPYDAVYVALAEALGAVLLTGDAAFARAAGVRCPVELVER